MSLYRVYFRHLTAAAFLAMAFRLSFERLCARALPPLRPPLRPSATAAGSLPSTVVSGGAAPVAMSTMSLASWLGSRGLLGFAMRRVWHGPLDRSSIQDIDLIQTETLPLAPSP
jgi:hypothetical protein